MGLLWTPKISRLSFSGVSDIFFCPWVGWTKCWHCLTLTRDITWLISDTSVFLVCISWCKCGYEPFPRTIWTLCLTVRWMVGKDEANITHPRCNKSTTNKLTLCVLLLFNNNHLMCLFFYIIMYGKCSFFWMLLWFLSAVYFVLHGCDRLWKQICLWDNKGYLSRNI